MMTSEKIRKLLAAKHMKVTPQRLVIVDYLVHTEDHPTADEIYEAVKDRIPACSKATIYNNLATLVDNAVIHAISVEPGITRYDANMVAHHHFIDAYTGKVYDIPWEKVQSLFNVLGEEYGIADYQVNFYGTKASNRPARKASHPGR